MNFPLCFGPYLRYAIVVNFASFKAFNADRADYDLFLLVAFKDSDAPGKFAAAINAANKSFNIRLGPSRPGSRYLSVRTARAAVLGLTDDISRIWDNYILQAELSLPLPTATPKTRVASRFTSGQGFAGKILLGVLDDGCPFAARQFLSAAHPNSTRVAAIWDQSADRVPRKVTYKLGASCNFGHVPEDFEYGLEFMRHSDNAILGGTKTVGLDEWISLHLTPANNIDEDACYAEGGFDSLKYTYSHGGHVMDVLAGRVPPSSRMSVDAHDPPSFKGDNDPAANADIVFVQFPKYALEDATGEWLPVYVRDGVEYIMSCAEAKFIDTVIINLSYGSTTGPHNGFSLLELTLLELVNEYDGSAGKPLLTIIVAAGNSYLRQGHVHFVGRAKEDGPFRWTWRLPPDNTSLCFAQIWMKLENPAGVSVELTWPDGLVVPATTSQVGPAPPAWVLGPFAYFSGDYVWVAIVESTIGTNWSVAEHGDYVITVSGVPKDVEVNVYDARTSPNMNIRSGARDAYFIDCDWERDHAGNASCDYQSGEFDQTGSLVSRFQTLNGSANGVHRRLIVAGGYVAANDRKSPFSSAGSARSPSTRVGPDFVMPADGTYALAGTLAGGTRSGSVFRLVGTSAAAPQLARLIANGVTLTPHNVPTDPIGKKQRGGGNISAP